MNRILPTAFLVPVLTMIASALSGQSADQTAERTGGSATGRNDSRRDAPASGKAYVRLLRDAKGAPLALQTRVVRLAAPPTAPGTGDRTARPLKVDLIGVVHMADRGYYRTLDRSFREYDALLYELVGPPGARPVPGAGSNNPLRMIQRLGEASLGLTSQLDHINYQAANFVHADLSPAGMKKAMNARGEDGLSLALGIASDLLRQANREAASSSSGSPLQLLGLGGGGAGDLKVTMATALAAQTGSGGGLGPTLDALLIGDRNAAAMRVLQRQIAVGQRSLGIFYGAAHMPDFERRLREDFGLRVVSETWHTAWRLDGPKTSPTTGLMNLLMRELQPGRRRVAPPRTKAKPASNASPRRRRTI